MDDKGSSTRPRLSPVDGTGGRLACGTGDPVAGLVVLPVAIPTTASAR
ncbi:MAG: hypothetical protein M3071_12105 [Actinomycetota bacterium]|nr:hypothetical protein [Actinomycetota bacterium]